MRLLPAALLAVAAGVVTGLISGFAVRVPPFWAVLVALPVAAFTLLALLLSRVLSPGWQLLPAPDESLTTHQASGLANQFDEAARDLHRFRIRVQPRLRRLALAKLRQRFPDLESLDDERARTSLGPDLYALLTNRDAKLPSPNRLTALLSRLEGM
jgi:hypothetical protein